MCGGRVAGQYVVCAPVVAATLYMDTPHPPPGEAQRLAALHQLGILDTPPDERFDRIVRLACRLFGVPAAFVSFIDGERQWFKACYGFHECETPRDLSFCTHTIRGEDEMVVPDARCDPRFSRNPLVMCAPFVRFYAGHPLRSPDGHRVGTLCVLDPQPRDLEDEDREMFRHLAAWVELELAMHYPLERAHTVLQDTELHLRAILHNAAAVIMTLDGQGRIELVGRAVRKIFGYLDNEIVGRPLSLLIPGFGVSSSMDGVQALNTGTTEVEGRRRDGTTVFIEISLSEMTMSEPPRFIAIARDISERRRMAEVARHRAYYDAMVGLPNLALLQERVKELSLTSVSSKSSFSVMLIELDRLRDINNTLGHPTGDRLLQEVGATLQGVLTDSELAAYLGAGTFAVVSPDTNKSGVHGIARRILDVLAQPFVLGHLTIDIGATAGVAVCPEHGQECARLLQRAAIALQATRLSGGGYQLYAEDKDPYTPRRLALMGDLHQTIEREYLFVVYQPKISLRTGAVVGVEALVRWKHSEFGLIAPDEFIPIAEQTGFIKRLTLWVLHTALHQCAVWKTMGLDLAVAVNISARTLHDTQLPTQVAAEIAGAGLTAASLELEITESTIMADPVRAMDVLTQLRRMGVRLSIDDFGTGYSSLGYLKKLPVDAVKIDKSFVLGMANDEDDAVIVRSIIDVAHTLGLQVVAEGIENQESVSSLVVLGCDEAQGYYVHRPAVPAQIEEWVQLGPGDHTRGLQKLRTQLREARTGQKSA